MKEARKRKATVTGALVLAVGFVLATSGLCAVGPQRAAAQEVGGDAAKNEAQYIGEEMRFCDAEDEVFFQTGGELLTAEPYEVACDSMAVIEDVTMPAPGIYYNESDLTGYCAPLAGANIAVFYDRFYPNLIPSYMPGMISKGVYTYFPFAGQQALKDTVRNMYTAMGTNVNGMGTSQTEFQNGLVSYVTAAGYSCSYSAFQNGTKSVNLQTLSTAVSQSKPGVIFCNGYNLVSSIEHDATAGKATVAKWYADSGHVMMVYGYQKVAYYNNGVVSRIDTLLHVSTGFISTSKSLLLLNENHLTFQSAQIVTIS